MAAWGMFLLCDFKQADTGGSVATLYYLFSSSVFDWL